MERWVSWGRVQIERGIGLMEEIEEEQESRSVIEGRECVAEKIGSDAEQR